MTVPFFDMGFSPTVTACSATPDADGYIGEFGGYPYQVHPTATPGQWAALKAAIAGNQVAITAWAAPPPLAKPALVAYANAKQWALATGGYTITMTPVGGTATPILFATDGTSLTLIAGKVLRLQQAAPPASVNWQTGPTTYAMIAASGFISASIQVADFVQATFDANNSVIAAITAGTTATTAQIDAAAWPSNVSTTAI
jgi:hypothetical protein